MRGGVHYSVLTRRKKSLEQHADSLPRQSLLRRPQLVDASTTVFGSVVRFPILFGVFPADVVACLLTKKILVPVDFSDFLRISLDRRVHVRRS